MAAEREEYMGDGLYASVEIATETLWLRAPRPSGHHIVAMDPPMLERFVLYACRQGFAETVRRGLALAEGGGR